MHVTCICPLQLTKHFNVYEKVVHFIRICSGNGLVPNRQEAIIEEMMTQFNDNISLRLLYDIIEFYWNGRYCTNYKYFMWRMWYPEVQKWRVGIIVGTVEFYVKQNVVFFYKSSILHLDSIHTDYAPLSETCLLISPKQLVCGGRSIL